MQPTASTDQTGGPIGPPFLLFPTKSPRTRGFCSFLRPGRPSAVNPLHDPLRRRDRIPNGRFQCRRGAAIPMRQVSRSENARCDQQHTFATFVHAECTIPDSPFVRPSSFNCDAQLRTQNSSNIEGLAATSTAPFFKPQFEIFRLIRPSIFCIIYTYHCQ